VNRCRIGKYQLVKLTKAVDHLPTFEVDRELAFLDRGEIRHPALVDAVRVGDDSALGGLPEDLGQTHDRHGTRGDGVGQYLPGPTDGS